VQEQRRGFGAACAAGLAAATAPIVAFCDADGSLRLDDLHLVCDPVLDGTADLVLGARRPTGRGAWPFHARVANRYLAHRLRRSTGVELSDLGPMRAGRRVGLVDLQVSDRRSGWPLEQVLRAGVAGWRIVEVPVPYAPRTGRSKVTGTVSGTIQAVRDMSRVLVELA
jgi:glycosyltransferase involved in cell wall biosynthesis